MVCCIGNVFFAAGGERKGDACGEREFRTAGIVFPLRGFLRWRRIELVIRISLEEASI